MMLHVKSGPWELAMWSRQISPGALLQFSSSASDTLDFKWRRGKRACACSGCTSYLIIIITHNIFSPHQHLIFDSRVPSFSNKEFSLSSLLPLFIVFVVHKARYHNTESTPHLHSKNKAMEVPTTKSLADIYPEDARESQAVRWNSLLKTFKDTYGKAPDFVSRSPGRVNIIGEVRSNLCSVSRGRKLACDAEAHLTYSTSTTVSMMSSQWP